MITLTLTVEAQKDFTVKTDSSTIETKFYPGGKEVREILKQKNLVYYKFYRNNLKILTSTATYDKSDRLIGIAKEYNNNGKFLYQIDYDKGLWTVANKKIYPYFDLQFKMKQKADSLIASVYGKQFLLNNAVWNVSGSYIYNKDESGNWTDIFKSKPNKFLFRYAVKLDKEHIYNDLIEFELDTDGNYLSNPYEEVFGFEKIAKNQKKGFLLSYDNAIKIAKQKGLVENDSTKASAFLKWENIKESKLHKGHFRFYVIIKTISIKNLNPKGRSSVTDKYDVYSFNPWTAEYLETKKMKSIQNNGCAAVNG